MNDQPATIEHAPQKPKRSRRRPPETTPAAQPPALTPNLAPLPSAFVKHADVFQTELQLRLATFDAGITTLNSELDGQQAAFDKDENERLEAFQRAREAREKKHDEAKADILRRIRDMERGKAMAAAALDAGELGDEASRKA